MQNQQPNKQSIIIVSSAPPQGLSHLVNQGVSSLQGQAQAQLSNIQGGGQALSLSGLSAQQLAQILQAYGVISSGNGNSISNQINQVRQMSQQPNIQIGGASSIVNAQVPSNSTNIIVVSTSGGNSSSQIQQLQGSSAQNLQQQIQQLQAQNQLMQQQILANLQMDLKSSSSNSSSLQKQQQLIQERIQQLNGDQQANFKNLNIGQNKGDSTDDLPHNFNKGGSWSSGPSHSQKIRDSVRLSSLHKQRIQESQDMSTGFGNDQAVISQLQQILGQNSSNHQPGASFQSGLLQTSVSSQNQGMSNLMESQAQNQSQFMSSSTAPRPQGKSQIYDSGSKPPFAPQYQQSFHQQQSSNPNGGQRHSSAQPPFQQTQVQQQSQKKKLKAQNVGGEQSGKPTKGGQSSKKSKEQNQSEKRAEDSNLKKSKKKSTTQAQIGSQDSQGGNRYFYQSATQRQKGGSYIESSQLNQLQQSNFNTQNQVNSPNNWKQNPKSADGSLPAGFTAPDFKQIIMKNSGQVAIVQKKKPKKQIIKQLSEQEDKQNLNLPLGQSSNKNQTSSLRMSPSNGGRGSTSGIPVGKSDAKKKEITSQTVELTPQCHQQSSMLLPPSTTTMTQKEKKRIKQEKEKEKERELFEKNFKASDLYICKMALNVQKSFITKPNAIIVYNQYRLVKLDITTNAVFQPSAVPQSVTPSVGAPQKPLLITPEELHDFYNHSKVKYFANVGRALEVVEEPVSVFKRDQESTDTKSHSIQERKIREELDKQLEQKNMMMDTEQLAKNPIIFPSSNIKETTIFFNSRFESGNLREVEKLNEFEYNLYVNFDFNSTTHSQWYFFSVRNIGKGKQYKFNIMNLQKDESCYQIGMKPFVYSTNKNKSAGTNQWSRGCENVCYYKNKLRTKARECAPDYEFDEDNIPCYEYEDEASQMVTLNTLSFCYEFDVENDITYFAYFQPYTLSDLEDFLFQIHKKYEADYLQNIYKCENLCSTVGGKNCYVLTITDNIMEDDINVDQLIQNEQKQSKKEGKDSMSRGSMRFNSSSNLTKENDVEETSNPQKKEEEGKGQEDLSSFSLLQPQKKQSAKDQANQKQTIFLTGRVHPGESNASFMIQGAIDFLLQKNNKEAKALRETFIFKIIPMLNPDGVVNGNYRCNYVGADLNRRWPNPSKLLHPTIYYTKKLLKMCHQDNQVLLFCDFHGHTRKRNVFMYGCVSPQTEINHHKNNNLIRIVPYLLDQKNKLFSFADCKFANEKEKESTGRLVMFKEFGILNSYTIESTFYSYYNPKMGQKKKVNVEDDQQIKADELLQIGNDFCETLMIIINSKILKRKFIVDTTTPLGSLLPGQGGNPLTQFLLNQQNENAKPSQQQSNVQSVIRSFMGSQNYQFSLNQQSTGQPSQSKQQEQANFNSRISQATPGGLQSQKSSPDKRRIVKRSETFSNQQNLELKHRSQTRKQEALASPQKKQQSKPSDMQLLQVIQENMDTSKRRASQLLKTQEPDSPEKKKRQKVNKMEERQINQSSGNPIDEEASNDLELLTQKQRYDEEKGALQNAVKMELAQNASNSLSTPQQVLSSNQSKMPCGSISTSSNVPHSQYIESKKIKLLDNQEEEYILPQQIQKDINRELPNLQNSGSKRNMPHSAHHTPLQLDNQRAGKHSKLISETHSEVSAPAMKTKDNLFAEPGHSASQILRLIKQKSSSESKLKEVDTPQKQINDAKFNIEFNQSKQARGSILTSQKKRVINSKDQKRTTTHQERQAALLQVQDRIAKNIKNGGGIHSIITSNQVPMFFNQAQEAQIIDQSTPIFTRATDQGTIILQEKPSQVRRSSRNYEKMGFEINNQVWKTGQEGNHSQRDDNFVMAGPEQQNIIEQYINAQNAQPYTPSAGVKESIEVPSFPSATEDFKMIKKGYTQKYGKEELDKRHLRKEMMSATNHMIDQEGKLEKVPSAVSISKKDGGSNILKMVQQNPIYKTPTISQSQKHPRENIIISNKGNLTHSSFSSKKDDSSTYPLSLYQKQQMLQSQAGMTHGVTQFLHLREQKSKSSLSVMSYNNQKQNQGSTLATPLKNPQNQQNVYYLMNQNLQNSGNNKSAQKLKSQIYKQAIINSAPQHHGSKQIDQMVQDYQAQMQNFCLPPTNGSEASLQSQIKQQDQRIIRKPDAQASIMNARQSYQSNEGLNQKQYAHNSAALNYKRNYIARNGGPIVQQQQEANVYQKSSYLDLPGEKGKKPGSTGTTGYGGLGNISQGSNTQAVSSQWGASLLPEINDNQGGNRHISNFTDEPRPSSQSKENAKIPSAIIPHRNIIGYVGPNSGHVQPGSAGLSQNNTLTIHQKLALKNQVRGAEGSSQFMNSPLVLQSNSQPQPSHKLVKGKSQSNLQHFNQQMKQSEQLANFSNTQDMRVFQEEEESRTTKSQKPTADANYKMEGGATESDTE